MSPTDVLLDLIKAFKKNDQEAVDNIIQRMVGNAEKRKQHKFAKKLREVYSKPSKKTSNVFFQPSSVTPSVVNDKQLFEVRKSKIDSTKIVLSNTNRNILNEIRENYNKRALLEKHGLTNDSRLILHGPPGTGKTLFAYVLAGELNLPLYHVNLDSLVSSYLGETGKNLKMIFDEASKEDCVLLLDEFDAIAKHRDDTQELGELKRVVTVLLQNIDNLNPHTILVAATNHEHLLDPAVWRRFAYSVKMDLMDINARKSLLSLYLGDRKDLDVNLLADLAEGLSGATIKQIINRSLRRGIINNDNNLQKNLVESFLLANGSGNERLKGSKRYNFIKALNYLREVDARKYTFEELEKITGMAASTLHNISTSK
jgi:SpoVK/Ycf46/Vps4 family AAA+-type ATPase